MPRTGRCFNMVSAGLRVLYLAAKLQGLHGSSVSLKLYKSMSAKEIQRPYS
jgi:hypothetical protein